MQYAAITSADMQHIDPMQPHGQLQQYSSDQFHASEPFMPSNTAAMQMDFSSPDGPFLALQQHPHPASAAFDSTASQVKWYGSLDTDAYAQQPASNAGTGALVKKPAPGDVSRHDTPTSVFDIFNSLSIVPGSAGQPCSDQHEQESLGQDPALTAIPHMHDSGMMYHEAEADDRWLEEFANSQVAAAQGSAAAQPSEQTVVSDAEVEGTNQQQ